MLPYILKYFSLILCSSYSYLKILNIKKSSKRNTLTYTVFTLIFSCLMTLFSNKPFISKNVIIFIMFFLSIRLYAQIRLQISFIVAVISFSLSYIALAFSGIIISVLITPFCLNISEIPSIYYVSISSILQLLFLHLLFHIKRLRNGMPFIRNNKSINVGISISFFIILLFIYLYNVKSYLFAQRFGGFIIILLLALALLIWWRRKITQSYVEKLRVSEVEALYKEISDKEHEIEKLHSNNRYLARIIHKDNKLIPAMELAVRNYLQNGMQMKPEDARQYGIDLLAQLQTMAADREGIIQNYHDDYRFRPQIGLYSVDAIIYYMERRAIPHSIRYEYQFDKGLKEVMLSYIDENDAIHLLSDAIENSIIATMHAIKKEIKIHIGFIQDILFMDISDTGLPFEPATYQNFGLLQHTTHKDSGGSGVGLLDIWKLKHKYKISLQIYEYPPDDHEYTKKIRFFFDRRNHFLIQSYRSQEITSLITRSDLHVFPYVEGSDFILTLDEEITEEAE